MNTWFYDVLPDGAWSRRSCFIVGGGASLKGFDFGRLLGRRAIAVNRSIEVFDANIWFSTAARLLLWILSGALGEGLRSKFLDSPATLKCLVTDSCCCFPPDVLILRRFHIPDQLSMSMREGIYSGRRNEGCNSGLGALDLALCLGADPIYLLGFDMKGGHDGKQAWHHAPYPDVESANVYPTFVGAFERISNQVLRRARVINLNPESALRCFPFGDVDDVLP